MDLLEEFLHCQKDDARLLRSSSNRVRLATSGGTVGEYRGVVAVKDAVEELLRCALVHFRLRGVVIEDAVEGKDLVLDLLAGGDDGSGEFLDRVVFWRIKHPCGG